MDADHWCEFQESGMDIRDDKWTLQERVEILARELINANDLIKMLKQSCEHQPDAYAQSRRADAAEDQIVALKERIDELHKELTITNEFNLSLDEKLREAESRAIQKDRTISNLAVALSKR